MTSSSLRPKLLLFLEALPSLPSSLFPLVESARWEQASSLLVLFWLQQQPASVRLLPAASLLLQFTSDSLGGQTTTCCGHRTFHFSAN